MLDVRVQFLNLEGRSCQPDSFEDDSKLPAFDTRSSTQYHKMLSSLVPWPAPRICGIHKLLRLTSCVHTVCHCLCRPVHPQLQFSVLVPVLVPACLSMCVSVHIPACLSMCVYPHSCMSVHMCICACSAHLSTRVSVHVPACLSTCVSVHVLHICPHVCLSMFLHICPHVCLSA